MCLGCAPVLNPDLSESRGLLPPWERLFLETARARAAGVEGFVANGAAAGDPLAQVLVAYCLSRPEYRGWLVQGQQALEGIDLTDKKKSATLAKLDAEIDTATKAHFEALKASKLAELEAQFAGEA
jgi:hypothetical protein